MDDGTLCGFRGKGIGGRRACKYGHDAGRECYDYHGYVAQRGGPATPATTAFGFLNIASGPQVTVFDAATLERLATVSGPHISNAFVSVSFSSDGAMLLAAGTDDSHAMSIFHLWEWRASPQPKCSGIHDARDPVLSVLLDPRFDNNVLVMCAHDVGLWRQGSNGFKRHPVQGLDLPVGVERREGLWALAHEVCVRVC